MNQLFATLDAKSQRIAAQMPRETIITDTVGFIRKLPHHLVASFRSTMEEAVAADLVLHVIDVSHPQHEEQREVGDAVLADLGVDSARVFEVYNKADRVDEDYVVQRRNADLVSALTGDGIDTLIDRIRDREREGGQALHLEIPHTESRLLARLHDVAEVQERATSDAGVVVEAWVPKDLIHEFERFMTVPRAKRRAS
jgi:GTP-binding protein HflX